jgi:ATP-dependent DNA helicase RecG
MNINILRILQQGEGISVEFKKAKNKLPESLFETICAFLNRNGGVVLLGVLDDGTVEGIELSATQQMLKDIANLCNNPQKLFPSFLLDASLVEYEGKTLIHIFVPISSQVHRCNGKVFDRNTDGDFELKTDDQIKNCYIRKNSAYSENTIYPFLYESDFVSGVVERVRRMIRNNRPDHPWNELGDMDFFRTSGLYRRDLATNTEGFTMAALLLFGKDEMIQSAIPHYKIDALLRRKDIDRYDDRENIRCNLIEAYDKLMAFVAKHLPDKFYLQGDQRISLREKIFREIIANMLIHREYANAYPSTFVIYANKVEAKNANKPHLYGQLLPNNFVPFPKNPHIAQIFTQIGRSEELGTGVRNVFKYSKAYSGSEKVEFREEDVFIVEVPLDENWESNEEPVISVDNVIERLPENLPELPENLSKLPENLPELPENLSKLPENLPELPENLSKLPENLPELPENLSKLPENLPELPENLSKLPENAKKIFEIIAVNPTVTLTELSKLVLISRNAVKNNISKLKNCGLITREGPDKGGYWKVIV